MYVELKKRRYARKAHLEGLLRSLRNLKTRRELPKEIRDKVNKKGEPQQPLSDLEECARKKFVESAAVYSTVIIRLGEMLFSDPVLFFNFCELLKTAEPPVEATTKSFITEEERTDLFNTSTIKLMETMDDIEYFTDELITQFGHVFKFSDDKDEFFDMIHPSAGNSMALIERQYMEQLRPSFDTAISTRLAIEDANQ